jgi:alkanesulfonate monooxygenase SsuD/methylene tetrahydromethanopterin reductase-like flavin-dependent oxidoreductase (luciferase family)
LRRVRHPEGYRYQHHLGPLPVPQPHPPVLLGGTAAPALRRAGRLAQGWIGSSRHDLTEIGTYVETVRDGARGRARSAGSADRRALSRRPRRRRSRRQAAATARNARAGDVDRPPPPTNRYAQMSRTRELV